MSTIQYEELDDFFEQVKELNKSRTIYMTIVRTKKEAVMSGAVRVMFKDEQGVLHQFNHTEDIQELQMLNPAIFDVVMPGEGSKIAKERYMQSIKAFEDALKNEAEKMKAVLEKEFGAVKIYNAYGI